MNMDFISDVTNASLLAV